MEKGKNMKKRYKKGITLIALVITIVIMLLLAGVAIQMSLGIFKSKNKGTRKRRT